MPAKESSCRLKRRNSSTFVTRLTPKHALTITMSLLAKSGLDDQVQSNSTAARPSMAALTTTMILNCLTCSRKSLTESALRMQCRHRVELAYACCPWRGTGTGHSHGAAGTPSGALVNSIPARTLPEAAASPGARLDCSMILRWLRLNTLLSRSESQPVLPGRSCYRCSGRHRPDGGEARGGRRLAGLPRVRRRSQSARRVRGLRHEAIRSAEGGRQRLHHLAQGRFGRWIECVDRCLRLGGRFEG